MERKAPSFRFRLLQWLRDAMNPDDPRSYDPVHIWRFCEKHGLCEEEPQEMYRLFVQYQARVYEAASKHFDSEKINSMTFYELVDWYEGRK